MEPRELVHHIEQAFGQAVLAGADEGGFPHVRVSTGELKQVLTHCNQDQRLRFDFLECMTAIDTGDDMIVIYQLLSTVHAHRINIKVAMDRHAPSLPTISGVWRAALCYEREVAEMFGVRFEGHPAPGRLLLPEDWQGHPLRKDYVYPEEYRGIEHRRAPLRKEHPRP